MIQYLIFLSRNYKPKYDSVQEFLRVQVRGSKRLRCHAGRQEVTRCHTIGESENPLRTRDEARKQGDPSWLWNPGQTTPEFKNRGISGPKKDLCPPKIIKKKKIVHIYLLCCWWRKYVSRASIRTEPLVWVPPVWIRVCPSQRPLGTARIRTRPLVAAGRCHPWRSAWRHCEESRYPRPILCARGSPPTKG